jgi:hypothetical protein
MFGGISSALLRSREEQKAMQAHTEAALATLELFQRIGVAARFPVVDRPTNIPRVPRRKEN